METKVCTKCHQDKPLSEYYRRKDRDHRPMGMCKTCWNERRREYDLKRIKLNRPTTPSMPQKQRKVCNMCKLEKDISEFPTYVDNRHAKIYFKSVCKPCYTEQQRKYQTERNHRLGICDPIGVNHESTHYLGDLTERLLSQYFEDVIRMPFGNPGYDFICKNGFKIDAKSSCLTKSRGPGWMFDINRNTTSDYFLCLAFDNRDDLTPLHVWLIPNNIVCHMRGLRIPSSKYGIAKWSKYERPLDKVLEQCNAINQRSANSIHLVT